MTGIAGCVGSLDPGIARGMVQALVRMGPDRQDQWTGEGAFLAHALLATTIEEEGDRQPLSFDGRYHLIADARIDARDTLIAALRSAGRQVDPDGPDSALILHAWHVWGEGCAERLIGDFAFAIWDAEERSLFAVRDHFGSVPFYYSRVGDAFLFGNAVPALLAHPGLDRSLNPLAIGDYLMFGYSIDRDAGLYRNIARLPPAHAMTVRGGEVRLRRYWTLPEPDFAAAEKMAPDEVVEAFGALFAQAVRDRLRTPRVATTLSGGMDSTMIAATALREGAGKTSLDAYSFGGDWLLPDTERHWAWRCAHHIGLPFHSISVERAFTDPPGGVFRVPPEPRMELRTSSYHLLCDQLVEEGFRVLLLGMGGDVIVAGGMSHWTGLFRDRRFGRLMREARRYWDYHHRRPPLRSAWRRLTPPKMPPIIAPLDPGFAREHRLEERWRALRETYLHDPRVAMANHPFWTELFLATHPESSGLPLRFRQPLFDVRLMEAAMRLPPTPWQFDKAILRRLGAGLLPDEILKRPKTPFGVNGGWEAARRGLEPWLAALPEAPELEGYVDRARLAHTVRNLDALPPHEYSGAVMLPASLAAWLRTHG